MPRIESLSVLLEDQGKMLLSETYDGVIENVQKGTLSSVLKNTDLSGNPESGTVEAKRFQNAEPKDYGSARTEGKGAKIAGKPVTIAINKDKEFVEELEQKDASLLGVEGLISRRASNHTVRMQAHLDRAFFKEAVAAGTAFTPATGITTMADKYEAAIVTLETLENEYIDGIDRGQMVGVFSAEAYSEIRKYLDTGVNNANVETNAESFLGFHGVQTESCTRLPKGVDFIVMMKGSIAQPVMSKPYSAEKVPLSEAYAMELFFYYGTKAVTPETILYYAPNATLTVTSAASATTSGKTKITVTEPKGSGNSYKYATGADVAAPALGEVVDEEVFKDWDGSAEITATTGDPIIIVEINAKKEVVKVGKATVTSKA